MAQKPNTNKQTIEMYCFENVKCYIKSFLLFQSTVSIKYVANKFINNKYIFLLT